MLHVEISFEYKIQTLDFFQTVAVEYLFHDVKIKLLWITFLNKGNKLKCTSTPSNFTSNNSLIKLQHSKDIQFILFWGQLTLYNLIFSKLKYTHYKILTKKYRMGKRNIKNTRLRLLE